MNCKDVYANGDVGFFSYVRPMISLVSGDKILSYYSEVVVVLTWMYLLVNLYRKIDSNKR